MTIPPKKVINSNPGDADHVGGNDWDDVADYMNNVDKTGPVKINTRTYFRSSKFELRNPGDTFSYNYVTSAITGDRTITLPALASNDIPVYNSFTATLSNKTLDATCDVSAATGTFAPTAAQYVTLATHANLSAERVWTAGDGISGTDGGAGGAFTVAQDNIDMARKRVHIIEDFFGYADATQQLGSVMAGNITGTGASVDSVPVTETGVFGVWQLTTGTTTTGASGVSTGDFSAFSLGQGSVTFEGYIKIPTLSAVGEEFIFRVGFGDIVNGLPVDMVGFEYDRLTSVNWRTRCRSNSVSSTSTTSTAVGTGWTRLKIVVNAAGTSADFFIGGSNVGTIATNVPAGVGRELTIIASIVKSAGTTARTAKLDYMALDMDLTTPR